MKKLEMERNKIIEKYIFLSQVLFFLVLGILFLRTSHLSMSTFVLKVGQITIFSLLLAFIPFVKYIYGKTSKKNIAIDLFIIIVYIIISSYLLVHEEDNIFKIVLLMPVLITALKYEKRVSIISSLFCAISIFFISFLKGAASFDADIMLTGVFILVSWLLGNMMETERGIRAELERLATHDSLTDILNHRSFQALLDEELIKARENNSKLSLLLLDIDFFKVYNDSLGHQKGDQVLVMVARILQHITKDPGYCARYGGEEFVVILPKMGIKPTKILAERIRVQIEETIFPGMEVLPKGRITVSIGIAEFPTMADGKEKLIQKADEALYKAKFVSKNKVETYFSVFDELSLSLKDEEQELFNSIRTLTMVINAKDKYTYGHSERVMDLTKRFIAEINLDKVLEKDLIYGALLHDIGKIEISREVLNKPKKLNNAEWQLFRQHPQWGADMIRPLKSLQGSLDIVLYHHENFDGTGYPQGLKGEEIPYGARILRIIDSYDAITTHRPYKEAMSMIQALEELLKYSGTHYDPVLLEQFCKMIAESENLPFVAK
ncbi:MAG: diguanylate cyclase [Peptococcaceae bacterium]